MWQKVIAKFDKYYKVWQKLLPGVIGIKNCDKRILQSLTRFTKCHSYDKVICNINQKRNTDMFRDSTLLLETFLSKYKLTL